jgi:hypothetical protein
MNIGQLGEGLKLGGETNLTQKERAPVPFCPNPTDFLKLKSESDVYQKLTTPVHNSRKTTSAVF